MWKHWQLNYVKKIWAEFQTIEAKGGIIAALKEGYPQAQVKAVLDERFKNLAFRRDVAVGNNMYANMTEELLDSKPENQETLRQKRVAQIEEYLASAEPDAVVKAQATLEAGTTEPGALIGLIELGALQKLTIRQIRKALDAGDIASETIEPLQLIAGLNSLKHFACALRIINNVRKIM